MPFKLFLILFSFIGFSATVTAHESKDHGFHAEVIPSAIEQARVTITKDANYRYIKSNGIPNHQTGQFPNRGNPNTISTQNHNYRVALNPVKGSKAKSKNGIIGIAINGIPFEPGTAEFWNRDRSSGLNYEALSGKVNLGLDQHNAHVQPTGTYHYHGIPKALVKSGDTLVGYAADGFGLYVNSQMKPSYRLKTGTRPNGPGGKYDGTFTSDHQYVAGTGNLDACNGATVNGEYRYYITENFPHISRCLYGSVDSSFERKGRGGPPDAGQQSGGRRPPPHHRSPPRF